MTITPRIETFTLDRPLAVRLKHIAGRITVTTSSTAECRVTLSAGTKDGHALVHEARIDFNSRGPVAELDIKVGRSNRDPNVGVVTVMWAFTVGGAKSKDSVDILLEVPEGTALDLTTVSGEIDCTAITPGRLSVSSASGPVTCGAINGSACIKTTSAGAEIGTVHGSLDAQSVSGSLRTGVVHGGVDAKSVSGSVTTCIGAAALVQVKTVSGDITVNVVPGMAVSVDAKSVSGSLRSNIPLDTVEPQVRSYLGGAVQIWDEPQASAASPTATPSHDALVDIRAKSISGDVFIGTLANA